MIYTLIALLFLHYVGDYICQSNWLATNKSKSLVALSAHIGIILLVFAFFVPIVVPHLSLYNYLSFVLWNAGVHFVIDFFTSKISSYFHRTNQIHAFFIVCGGDQLGHQAVILLLYSKFIHATIVVNYINEFVNLQN